MGILFLIFRFIYSFNSYHFYAILGILASKRPLYIIAIVGIRVYRRDEFNGGVKKKW